MPKYLTREQFLAHKKLATRDVEIPDLGTIRVREPKRLEWDEFEHDGDHYGVRLVVAFAVDEQGKRLFQDEDVTRLLDLGTSKVETAAWAIMDLAGRTRAAQEAIAKNLKVTRTPSSNSD